MLMAKTGPLLSTHLFHSNTPNIVKTCKFTKKNCGISPINAKSSKSRVLAVGLKRVSMKAHKKGIWEDPVDGNSSEYDDGYSEGDEEYEWDGEAESESEANVSGNSVESSSTMTTTQYEMELFREVEQLLGQEEKSILEQNEAPDLSKISTMKWSPLQTLGLAGMIPFMDKLLEQGVDIDAVDKDGLTALHKAVIGKREPVISHLLRKGANPHVRDKNGATPLHYAVQVGALQTVKLLIKYKVDVNVADDEGWTPLHVSIQSRCRYITKVLLVNGADKTRRTKDGKTPLDISLCYGKDFKSYELAKLLKLVPANRDY
ncbi:hypothetical protein GIB67_004274 [Kingdonia uniflora]|uniref:Ankyrin repeat domain-containing protein EMB506, chloroplastic n=1 Tax=Kingdonia uniflora TaxID=39325 RepID=A0A7J7MR36_9MAGN|nr:hypothetical protein GIB67_004274 [Kingdonia uniflora]